MRLLRRILIGLLIFSPVLIQAQQDTPAVTQITALHVFTGSLDAVAFSPDGTLIASGGRDNAVRLWDTESGENTRIFEGHDDWVTRVVFSPDGALLASGARDDTVRLWDVETGAVLQTIHFHNDDVTGLAFTPDGKVLASGSRDGTIRIGPVGSDAVSATLKNFGGPVWDIVFSPDGTTLASASEDGTIWLWGLWGEEGVWLVPLRGHDGPVMSLAYAPDGETLLSGGQDGTVRLWNLTDLSDPESVESVIMRGHLAPVTGVGFSPDGQAAISVSLDGTVRLWDVDGAVEIGRELATITGKGTPLTNLTVSPDFQMAASAGTDGVMRLWDVGETAIQTLIDSQRPVMVVQNPEPGTSRSQLPPVPDTVVAGPVISIPAANIRVGIKTFYLDGVSWAIDPWEPLVGHLEGTVWLDNVGNLVLGGHSEYPNGKPGVFAGLYNVHIGDGITVQDGETRRDYVVSDVRTVRYDDLSVVYPTSHNRLTLITCDIASFEPQTGTYGERLVVIADGVS
jgi:LPXTG-site transpeptidase (sortase) family protein